MSQNLYFVTFLSEENVSNSEIISFQNIYIPAENTSIHLLRQVSSCHSLEILQRLNNY